MQFMLEYGCRLNPAGAWYIMPSFRSEPADDTHLNEFFHSEAEIPGALDDVMDGVEQYFRNITTGALARMKNHYVPDQDLSHIEQFLQTRAIPCITFDNATVELGNDPNLVEHHSGWRTITRAGEQRLLSLFDGPVWLTHFDHLSVPFYQAYCSQYEASVAANADLLCGAGEMIGAGERHSTGDQVRHALRHHEVPDKDYTWYIQMKDAFPMQTSGFGLGVERWLQWLTKTGDIRNLQLVPRVHDFPTIP